MQKVSPLVKPLTPRGDTFATYEKYPPHKNYEGGYIPHVAKVSPHAFRLKGVILSGGIIYFTTPAKVGLSQVRENGPTDNTTEAW